ncbi:MAG: hypothetical protein AAF800_05520 [Planctomycetota bacterium]
MQYLRPGRVVASLAVSLLAGVVTAGADAAERPDATPQPPDWYVPFYRDLWTSALGPEVLPTLDEEQRGLVLAAIDDAAHRVARRDWWHYRFPAPSPDRARVRERLGALGEDQPILAALSVIAGPRVRNVHMSAMGPRLDAVEARHGPLVALTLDHAAVRISRESFGLNDENRDGARRRIARRLAAALRDGPWEPAYDRSVVRLVQIALDDLTIAQQEELGFPALGQAPPEDRAWVTHVVLGELATWAAWERRGGGWANETNEQQWQGFREYLAVARTHFRAAWSRREDRPEPADGMITALQGDGESAAWLDRAVAADPADDRPWNAMSHFQKPRWGGSYDRMWRFAEDAFRRGTPGSAVADWPRRQYEEIIDDGGRAWLFAHRARVWPTVERWVIRRETEPHRPDVRDAQHHAFGIAMQLERHDAAAGLFDAMGRPEPMAGWYPYGLDQRWSRGRLAAASRPQAAAARAEARRLAALGRPDDAVRQLRETADDLHAGPAGPMSDDAWAARSLRDEARRLRWQQQLDDGQWVDLLEHGLEGWDVSRGLWRDHPDGGTVGEHGDPQSDRGLRIIAPLVLPARYEVELRMSLPEGWYRGPWKGAGLLLDADAPTRTRSVRFLFTEHRSKLWINDDRRPEADYRYFDVPGLTRDVTLRLRGDNDRLTLAFDGTETTVDYTLLGSRNDDGRLGLGALTRDDRSVGPIHYRSLRVRALNAAPAPAPGIPPGIDHASDPEVNPEPSPPGPAPDRRAPR